MSAFQSDAASHSMRAFIRWVEENPTFADNVNSGDPSRLADAVRTYYGAYNPRYTNHVQANIERYELQKPAAMT